MLCVYLRFVDFYLGQNSPIDFISKLYHSTNHIPSKTYNFGLLFGICWSAGFLKNQLVLLMAGFWFGVHGIPTCILYALLVV